MTTTRKPEAIRLTRLHAIAAHVQRRAGHVERDVGVVAHPVQHHARIRIALVDIGPRAELVAQPIDDRVLHALGRELGFSDRPMVVAAAGTMKKNKYALRSLVRAVVASEAFGVK